MTRLLVALMAMAFCLACGAKDIATLKANPAIHRTVVAQGDYETVYERIQAKVLECGPAGPATPFFRNSASEIIEVSIGNRDGYAFYYSIRGAENGSSVVDIYSQFKSLDDWSRLVSVIEMGALGECGCP